MATSPLPFPSAKGHSRPVNDHPSPESEPQRLALLGHELRTPLNAIIGYAEAMASATFGPLPAPYGEHAATIARAAAHLLALVDDITDQAQAEAGVWAGVRSAFDPVALVEEVTGLLRARADTDAIVLTMAVQPELGQVCGDRRGVRQIVLNLLDNALKHTARGGAVGVSLSREAGDLRMAVTDSGGRVGEKGPGLGLRLVRALAGAHGGDLVLAPGVAGGTEAVVRMPILQDPERP